MFPIRSRRRTTSSPRTNSSSTATGRHAITKDMTSVGTATNTNMPPFHRRRDDNDNDEFNGLLEQQQTEEEEKRPEDYYLKPSSYRNAFKSPWIRGCSIGTCCLLLLLLCLGKSNDDTNSDAPSLRLGGDGTTTSKLPTTTITPHLQITPLRSSSSSDNGNNNTTQNNFCFLHISKCAGASWIELLKNKIPNFYPKHSHGEEYSLEYSQQTYGYSNTTNFLLSVKSPRRHLWSLFTECKYDDWGRKQIRNTNFPNAGGGKHTDDNPSEETDDEDFVAWMQHFFEDSNSTLIPKKVESFKCYHPSNYQARHLVSHQKVPHVTTQDDVDVVPPLGLVMEKYRDEIAWTALTEFFHASQCLLYWRYTKEVGDSIDGDEDKATIEEMTLYLQEHCICTTDGQPTHTETIVTHHAEGHRETFWDMPASTLKQMDALTSVDRALYQQALVDFLANVIEMEFELHDPEEQNHILCDYATAKYEKELEYLLVNTPTNNVTKLVELMRKERIAQRKNK